MNSALLLVALAWLYVAVMMAAAEATGPNGTLFGALVTLLLYGVGPLAIVLYLMATPARRRLRRAREAAEQAAAEQSAPQAAPAPQADADAAQGAAAGSGGEGPAGTGSGIQPGPPSRHSALDPDCGSHAAGDAVAPVREEP